MSRMSTWWGQFKEFALKGNALDLAVAVVLGGAFQGIVTGLVDHIIMPLISYVTPEQEDYASWKLGRVEVGAFLASLVNFLLISLVLFVVIQKILGSIRKAVERSETAGPTSKECPFCLSTIPIKAVKCASCTADLPPPAEDSKPGAGR